MKASLLYPSLAGFAVVMALAVAIAIWRRNETSWTWLLASAALILAHDATLTELYGLVPLQPWMHSSGHWNWFGKACTLLLTLAVAGSPAVGWRRTGITLAWEPGSVRPALILGAIIVAIFTALAFAFAEKGDLEALAFQWTMPGLEEETFYRGLLLYAFDRALAGRVTILGAAMGWSAVLSSVLFGIGHGVSFHKGAFAMDPGFLVLPGLAAMIFAWLRVRTGNLVLPIVLHNYTNAIFLMVP